MSNTIVKTLLNDGPKKAIVSLYLESDGVEGELKNYPVLDCVNDFVGGTRDMRMAILQVWYGFSWFDGILAFDDLNPMPSWQLPRDTGGYYDFRYFGGVQDRTSIDRTSKLYLSTNGFAQLGSVGTIIIEVKKD
jgi:hypothetical protein